MGYIDYGRWIFRVLIDDVVVDMSVVKNKILRKNMRRVGGGVL